MGKAVSPKVYWVGQTTLREKSLLQFLRDTKNDAFVDDMSTARVAHLGDLEIMSSAFAKLCYASLTPDKNANVTKTRSIEENIKATLRAGHGSILEHNMFNFLITDCSRVFTHELCRHRVGTAFSQTSGRYCRLDDIDLVVDPILQPVADDLQEIQQFLERKYAEMVKKVGLDVEPNFDRKKKLTSALRRIAPNGQSNQMAFSANLRTLRHTIMLRTARHAEWEIRNVFAQIYRLVKGGHPLLFCDAKEEIVDGELEVTGMKIQPFEAEAPTYTSAQLRRMADQLDLAS
jgi:thymidylate synthase (FAD)